MFCSFQASILQIGSFSAPDAYLFAWALLNVSLGVVGIIISIMCCCACCAGIAFFFCESTHALTMGHPKANGMVVMG